MLSVVICLSIVSALLCQVEYCNGRHVVFVHNRVEKTIKPLEVKFGDSPPPQWVVKVSYHDNVETTGWIVSELTTNTDLDPEFQSYVAGFAEGYLTFNRISQNWNNTIKDFCVGPKMTDSCKKIHDFIENNLNWMLGMIKKNPNDQYWKEVNKALLQVQGLEDGYNNVQTYNPTIRLKPFGFLLFQWGGDLEDLEVALGTNELFRRRRVIGSGSCSALIKMVEDKSGEKDLLVAQDTWAPYVNMLRIIKRYNFGSYSVAFSSNPGSIFSGDDFYILNSGMVTMETTNGNSNNDLWKYVTTETVPDWLRNIVANRLAKNGKAWCETFSRYNSGTYNNQWMIVDYNQFEKQVSTGVLYILEQLPGEIEYADLTEVLLNQTYWASYNSPYFPKIFNDSGLPALVKKYGDWFTHDKTPRALIFKRDHKKVTDLDSMIKLMRYNDFKNDPLSKCDCTPPYSAENAIAARSDLNPIDGKYPFAALGHRDHGATDVKVTSYALHKSLSMMAECGPTHDQQPVFQWSTSSFANLSHEGHPDKFDFKPELIVWDK